MLPCLCECDDSKCMFVRDEALEISRQLVNQDRDQLLKCTLRSRLLFERITWSKDV